MKQYAKTAIINSFKELLDKQSIDKVTVKKICEHCDVNRQTFYYHYSDIRDIYKFIITKELFIEIGENKTFDTWQEGFLATMSYLKTNSKMIIHIYKSSYFSEVNVFFKSISNKLLNDVIEECAQKMSVKLREKDKVFMINFYIHIFNGTMMDWVSKGMDEPPEIVLKRLSLMIQGSIPRAVFAFNKEQIKG